MTALPPRFPESGELARVADALSARFGFQLSAQARARLPETLAAVAATLQRSVGDLVSSLLAGDARGLEEMVERLLVGETWFLRYPEQLEAAVRAALALAGDERLVAWSAGCSYGEEAYSLAMLLLERGRDGRSAFVLGTDLSARSLAHARVGRYAGRSFRGTSPAFVVRHFEAVAGRFTPKARARELVAFRRHNLVGDALAMHGAHLVSCRNVLIYFEPEVAVRVLRELYEALVPGGLLIVGPAEQPFAGAAGFEWTGEAGQLLFRRPVAARPGASGPRPVHGRANLRLALAPGPAAPPTERTERLAAARDAEARGEFETAEALARAAATELLLPEAWLLVAALAERRGDGAAALEATRQALFLEPGCALAHAAQARLFRRAGLHQDAQRATRNALAALSAFDEGTLLLRGVEPVSVGTLRRALEAA